MTYSTSNFEPLTEAPKLLRKETANRLSYTAQNQSQQTEAIYIAPFRFSDTRQALQILPSGALLRDIYTPTGEIWASTTAAGEALGEGLTLGEDFI